VLINEGLRTVQKLEERGAYDLGQVSHLIWEAALDHKPQRCGES
jgi:hypothetical protein